VSKKDTLINASSAKSVHLVKKWNGWNASFCPLNQVKTNNRNSMWKGPAYLESGICEYAFPIDGIWQNNAGSAPYNQTSTSLRQ
jgi:hypothetical protein